MILLGGTAVAAPLAARAQQKAMPAVGFLASFSPGQFAFVPAAFLRGLSDAGYVVDQNLAIEYRWAEGNYDRLPGLAADLVSRKVDVIVTFGGTPAALAAKGATPTIPIVFSGVGDPVGVGLVASLARPGGNVTGFSNLLSELTPKVIELLSDLVPQARVIALLINPNNSTNEGAARGAQEAARTKGVQLNVLKAGTDSEIDAAFAALDQLNADALLIGPDPLFGGRLREFADFAAGHALPAMYYQREFAVAGGLISYGPSFPAINRQAGTYAGRILKGEKPAELPVQQPTTFELVVNLKTAKALGLTVPQALLARADEVIE
jgi:putative ABC transport system substrate-binding protein